MIKYKKTKPYEIEFEGENMNKSEFRFAEEKDASLILQFIKELANYEKCLTRLWQPRHY